MLEKYRLRRSTIGRADGRYPNFPDVASPRARMTEELLQRALHVGAVGAGRAHDTIVVRHSYIERAGWYR